ncbi:MAG: histidine--tRNA ligase [Bacillota bacterium]|jgi:histidyl-tRNA synthetase
MYQAPRGTRDFLPEQAERFRRLEELAVNLARQYGYGEMRTPIFEYTELFQRGVGEATDIVEKEMYTFSDRGERNLTLRPEGTAGVVRAFVEHKLYNGALPAKYFYFGPMFRYEKPQAGRYRQLWQFGVELLGASGPRADVEVIALGWQYYKELGIDTRLVLNSIGCNQCRARYRQALISYLQGRQMCELCVSRLERNPLRVLDCKNTRCQEEIRGVPLISDYLCEDCQEHFAQVKAGLDRLDIPYALDPRLVRGLDYYNRTTFEYKTDSLGSQDALGGGGRYDGLVELLGGPSVPAVGLALGVDRIELMDPPALKAKEDRRGIWLVTMEPVADQAIAIAHRLRQGGCSIQYDLLGKGFKAQFKQADRNNCRWALIMGPDDLDNGRALLRDLETGEQRELALESLAEILTGLEGAN